MTKHTDGCDGQFLLTIKRKRGMVMPLVPVNKFNAMVRALERHLENAAADFVAKRGVTKFNRRALRQMSQPLGETALQMLSFGADIWPISTVAEDGVTIVPAQNLHSHRPRARRTSMEMC